MKVGKQMRSFSSLPTFENTVDNVLGHATANMSV